MIISSLRIADGVEMSSLFSQRFIRALTICYFATYWSVNAMLVYLMRPVLALRCVDSMSCDSQVFFSEGFSCCCRRRVS